MQSSNARHLDCLYRGSNSYQWFQLYYGNRKRDLEVIGATNDDLEFIAHAKQDIPLLIAEIEHLKSMLSK